MWTAPSGESGAYGNNEDEGEGEDHDMSEEDDGGGAGEIVFDMDEDAPERKKAKTPRSREKQIEKEIPWTMIPEEMRADFKAAEMVQWNEHVETGALEVLSVKDSEEVRRTQPASRPTYGEET